jgi:dihydroxyacetone kinase
VPLQTLWFLILGLGGIHNEPGHSRLHPIPTPSALVDKLIGYLFATPESDADRAFLPWPKQGTTSSCVLLVNNLGGLSALELSSIAKTILEKTQDAGVVVERMLVGTYMVCKPLFNIEMSLNVSLQRRH